MKLLPLIVGLGLTLVACGDPRPGFRQAEGASAPGIDASVESHTASNLPELGSPDAGTEMASNAPIEIESSIDSGTREATTPSDKDSEVDTASVEPMIEQADAGAPTEPTLAPTQPAPADASPPESPAAQPGEACEVSTDCAGGHCVDDVCCNSACDELCARCDDPTSPGTCTATESDDACPVAACPPDSECRQHELVADAPTCQALGECATEPSCVAVDVPAATPCSQAAGTCDGEGECIVPNKATLGQTCALGTDCGSGHCSASPTGALICCDAACDGLCAACSTAGRCDQRPADDAQCAVVQCDPGDECTTYPAPLTNNRCAAFGQCTTEEAHCEPEFEEDGTECGPSSVCDGEGECVLSCPVTTGPNRTCTEECPCGAGEGVCTTDDDCVDSLVCTPDAAAKLGFPGSSCLPAHCVNNLRDSGETSVDCGGGCGCRATYEVVQISLPRDTQFSELKAMSGDGSVFAGNLMRGSDSCPVRVSSSGSVTELQRFGANGQASDISADGSTVIGSLSCADPPSCATDYPGSPFRWIGTQDPTDIYAWGAGYLTSATGSISVGTYYDNDLQREVAFRVGTNESRFITDLDAVKAMSADGQFILGRPPQSSHWEVWSVADEGLVPLTQPLSWTSSNLTAINADGSVIAGWSWEPPEYHYFVLRNGTFTVLPEVSEGTSVPYDISADGTRLVGGILPGDAQVAFIWDETGGVRSVVEECEARGLELPVDLSLATAHFLSDNGNVIVGYLYGATTPSFWRVTLLD